MSVSLTVMTFNLHEDQPPDSPNSWEKRRDLCLSVITSYSPLILCTQQGVKSQLDYLQQGLPGKDRSPDTSDEHCNIFYDKEKVELVEGGTFWLSESPSVPGSMSWGSVVPCIATWVIFQLKGVEPPGFSFQIVNTNIDEFSPRARRRSALLAWQHIASLPPSLPVVYCGGFNTQKRAWCATTLPDGLRQLLGLGFRAVATMTTAYNTKLMILMQRLKRSRLSPRRRLHQSIDLELFYVGNYLYLFLCYIIWI
ncbi:uncharacterized protein LOC122296273 isoform X2 [Carya illinoinensis]|uniref:uncharacterized protein LOC122296273 isoform X2 n=1 Tax=Carya illinoinensis TaxID=32201 RepID=UPI001C717D0C|nr:uncharacterized protein LOC122296273 isoform X2 [Carya illinoinensis]